MKLRRFVSIFTYTLVFGVIFFQSTRTQAGDPQYAPDLVKNFDCRVEQRYEVGNDTQFLNYLNRTTLVTSKEFELRPGSYKTDSEGVVIVDIKEMSKFWIEATQYGGEVTVRVRYGEHMAMQTIQGITPSMAGKKFELGVFEGKSFGKDYYFLVCETKGGDPRIKNG